MGCRAATAGSWAVISMPGGAEAALQGIALMEGLLKIGDHAAFGQAFDRSRSAAPSACTANIRHECTTRPSSRTRQAPQTPISQPGMRAGQLERLAQEIRQRVARRNARRHLAAVDDQADRRFDGSLNGSCLMRISRRAGGRAARGRDGAASPAAPAHPRAGRDRRPTRCLGCRDPLRRPGLADQRCSACRARSGVFPTEKNTMRMCSIRSSENSARMPQPTSA